MRTTDKRKQPSEPNRDERLSSTPNEHVELQDGRSAWLSRSMAVLAVLTAYDRETNSYYVAVSKRGPGSPDYHNDIAICGGYLDNDETLRGAAIREIWEEVGINLYELADTGDIELPEQPFHIMSEPSLDTRQNVTARFHFHITSGHLPQLNISNSEPNEVLEAFWLKLERQMIENTSFAFNHGEILLEMNQSRSWWKE